MVRGDDRNNGGESDNDAEDDTTAEQVDTTGSTENDTLLDPAQTQPRPVLGEHVYMLHAPSHTHPLSYNAKVHSAASNVAHSILERKAVGA